MGGGGSKDLNINHSKEKNKLTINITEESPEKAVEPIFDKRAVDNTTPYTDSVLKSFQNNSMVQLIVRLKDKSQLGIKGTKEEKRELLRQRDEWFKENTQEFLSNLSDDNIHILSNISDGFVAMVTKEGFDELVNNRQVMSVNLDIIGSISLDDSTPLINSDEVWSLGYTGSGIKVCVIDSGVNASHPDLTGKINSEYCYCDITNLGGGGCCLDLTDEDANARDDMGHGTHVVGIISSQDSTFKGVSYDASLYVVKVTNSSGNYYMSDLGKAIDKCRSWGVDVISISLADNLNHPGNSPCPTTIDSDINEAYSADISVVIASGNNAYTTGISYPACSPNAISVGATTKSDAMAYFTNRKFGLLDLLAPGQSIVSLRWDKQRTMPGCTAYGNDFMICSGTSQAAPHVAGAAALLLEAKSTLTPDQIRDALNRTGKSVQSWKRINVSAALDYVCDFDNDGYYNESCSGGNDCNDNDGSIHPGATEVCDGKDNDCDSSIDENCEGGETPQGSIECNYTGYDQCTGWNYGDCSVKIAVNWYTSVNNIKWGSVNDSFDPYVINEYRIGWAKVDLERAYYGSLVNTSCTFGGCDEEKLIADEGTMVATNGPALASTEMILGYDDTVSNACWVWFDDFNPFYVSGPIYVLNCYEDSDCSSNQYCDKSGIWSSWDCVSKKSDGQSCTSDSICLSNYCDNDGVGLSDDGWCFTPNNTYFDGQETSYCEYSSDEGIADCDEGQVGDDLNKCVGITYFEEECSSTCTYQDITSVFECTDTGCTCSELLCDGQTNSSNITSCTSGQTFFADKCTLTAGGEDRGDNICRNSSFANGCTADSQCNDIVAGTGHCNSSCSYIPVLNLSISSLSNLTINNTHIVFESLINNSGSTELNNVNWTINLGDGNVINSAESFSLSSGSTGFVYVEHNYTTQSTYTVNATATSGEIQASKTLTLYLGNESASSNIDVYNFSAYNISSNDKIFEFMIKNIGDEPLSSISWSLNTGISTINSEQAFDLGPGNLSYIFVEYNYNQTGDFAPTASAISGANNDEETLQINIPSIDASDLTMIYNNTLNTVFSFKISNLLSTALTSVNWTFKPGDDNTYSANELYTLSVGNSSFVFIEHTYASPGAYIANATAINSSLQDSITYGFTLN